MLTPADTCRLLLAATLLATASAAAADPQTPPMETDPALDPPPAAVQHPAGIEALWVKALDAEGAVMRRRAIEAFAAAHAEGLAPADVVADRLVTMAGSDPEAAVRTAAAGALVTLGSPRHAAPVFDLLSADAERALTLAVDAALTRWRHAPAAEAWAARLTTDAAVDLKRSAVAGLVAVGHTAAVNGLAEIAADPDAAVALRLDAARAVGVLAKTAQLDTARRLADGDATDRLMAASMLAAHRSDAAADLLDGLLTAADSTTATRIAAADALMHARPDRLAGRFAFLAAHPHAGVRRRAAELGQRESVRRADGAAARFVNLLNDPAATVRARARATLADMHGQGVSIDGPLRGLLRGQPPEGGETAWWGYREAAWLAGQTARAPLWEPVTALLNHDRPEVRIAAAWAVGQLGAEEAAARARARFAALSAEIGETYTRIDGLREENAELQAQQERRRSRERAEKMEANTEQINRLFEQQRRSAQEAAPLAQSLGQLADRDALPLLTPLVPKDAPAGAETRASAVWAIGKILAGDRDGEMTRTLLGRVRDRGSMMVPAEVDAVRAAAAVAVGRIGDPTAVEPLRAVLTSDERPYEVAVAARWALEQMTGEPQPPIPTRTPVSTEWFLRPTQ